MGPEGRRYLLKDTARSLELDADKAVPDASPTTPPVAGGVPLPAVPGAPGSSPGIPGEGGEPAALNPAGEPVAGQDFNLSKAKRPAPRPMERGAIALG
jgi:hypothetical protein